MDFTKFSGNTETLQALSLAFEEGRLSHAVLLEGLGAQELALLLAQAMLCTGEGERPCGICPGCAKVLAGSHPDLSVISGSGSARSFHVDAIREIRSGAYIRPNEAACKAYVLLGTETMSEQAQNALLKILEEPPANVLFLLTVSSASLLLPTILSRVQVFRLDAGSKNMADPVLVSSITRAVTVSGEAELLFLTVSLLKDREALRAVLEQLVLVFRDACVLRAGGKACLSGLDKEAAALSSALTRDRLLLLLQSAQDGLVRLSQNANTALLTTWLCAHFRAAAGL